jgi:hypothetical protein
MKVFTLARPPLTPSHYRDAAVVSCTPWHPVRKADVGRLLLLLYAYELHYGTSAHASEPHAVPIHSVPHVATLPACGEMLSRTSQRHVWSRCDCPRWDIARPCIGVCLRSLKNESTTAALSPSHSPVPAASNASPHRGRELL